MKGPFSGLATLLLGLTLLSAIAARAESVQKIEVRESGLVADLWIPVGDGPFPGLLLLSGSGGGIGWQDEIGEMIDGATG